MNSIQGKGKRRKASQNKTVKTKQQPKKSQGDGVLSTIGGAIGNLVGLKDLGRSAGSWISKVTGLGEYKLHSNVFAKSSSEVPTFEYGKDGSIIITHREMVSDLIGSVAFTSQLYDIHPLNPILFPWLSIEALGYEQYEFLGLLACFNSTCGDAIASTNNALGTIIFSTEYDVSRPPFLSKSEMESYMFTSAKKPSESFIHPIECNPRMDILNARYNTGYFRTQAASTYTTPTSLSSNVAENLNCLGRLQVSTVGQQAVTTVGELWVTYRIKLTKTRAPPPGLVGGFFHAGSNNIGVITSGSTAFASHSVYTDSTLQADGVFVSSNAIGFNGLRPRTKVTIVYQAKSTGGTLPTFDLSALTLHGLTSVVQSFDSGVSESGSNTDNYAFVGTYYLNDFSSAIPNPFIVLPNPTISGSGAVFKWDLTVYITAWMPQTIATPLLSPFERTQALNQMYIEMKNRSRILVSDDDMKEEVLP